MIRWHFFHMKTLVIPTRLPAFGLWSWIVSWEDMDGTSVSQPGFVFPFTSSPGPTLFSPSFPCYCLTALPHPPPRPLTRNCPPPTPLQGCVSVFFWGEPLLCAYELGISSWKGLSDHLVLPLHLTKEKAKAPGDLVQGEALGSVAEPGAGSRPVTFHVGGFGCHVSGCSTFS